MVVLVSLRRRENCPWHLNFVYSIFVYSYVISQASYEEELLVSATKVKIIWGQDSRNITLLFNKNFF